MHQLLDTIDTPLSLPPPSLPARFRERPSSELGAGLGCITRRFRIRAMEASELLTRAVAAEKVESTHHRTHKLGEVLLLPKKPTSGLRCMDDLFPLEHVPTVLEWECPAHCGLPGWSMGSINRS